MAQYTTDPEAMRQGAARVEDASMQIRQHLAALRNEVDTMMAGWRGEAARSFVQVHEAFEGQAGRINAALARMHDTLTATRGTYQRQETTQTHAFAGLAGRING